MKKIPLLLGLLLLIGLPAWSMSGPPPLPPLAVLQSQVSAELYSLDSDLADAAQKLATAGLTGDTANDILQKLYDRHPAIADNVTISLDCHLLAVAPYRYQKAIGEYIGDQPHIIQLKKSNQPVMSEMFKVVEGFWAVAIVYPVNAANGKTLGYVGSVVKPDALFRNVLIPYIAGNLSIEATAIETDGQIIYDKDLLQIGKNTFTDPAYRSFASLLDLARRITAEASGTGTYTFSTGLGNAPVEKVSEWTTISLHGIDWRFILSQNK